MQLCSCNFRKESWSWLTSFLSLLCILPAFSHFVLLLLSFLRFLNPCIPFTWLFHRLHRHHRLLLPDVVLFHSHLLFPCLEQMYLSSWTAIIIPFFFWWLCNGCYDGDHDDDDGSNTIPKHFLSLMTNGQWTHLQFHALSPDHSSFPTDVVTASVVNPCQVLTPALRTVDSSSDSKLVLISLVLRVEVSITTRRHYSLPVRLFPLIFLFCVCVFSSECLHKESLLRSCRERDRTFCFFILLFERERETTSNISFCSKGLKPWNILSRKEQRSCCWRSCDDDSGLSEHCSCFLGVKKLSEIFEKKKTGRRITFCKKRGKETPQRLQSRECNQGKSQWIPLYAFTGNKTSETEWEPEENLWEHPWMRMIWWQKEERRRRVQRSRELESLEIDCLCKEIRGKIDAHRELIQWFLGWEKSWDEH